MLWEVEEAVCKHLAPFPFGLKALTRAKQKYMAMGASSDLKMIKLTQWQSFQERRELASSPQ